MTAARSVAGPAQPRRAGTSAAGSDARRARSVRRAKTAAGTTLAALAAVYVLIPIYWLVVASSKNTGQLFSTSTFLPPAHLSWGANFAALFTVDGGYFGIWILNSAVYALVTATLATAVSTLCGYGLAKYTLPRAQTCLRPCGRLAAGADHRPGGAALPDRA